MSYFTTELAESGVFTINFSNPSKSNALSGVIFEELAQIFDQVS
jgi:enoyl-CoA hydratase/carnithine racemase